MNKSVQENHVSRKKSVAKAIARARRVASARDSVPPSQETQTWRVYCKLVNKLGSPLSEKAAHQALVRYLTRLQKFERLYAQFVVWEPALFIDLQNLQAQVSVMLQIEKFSVLIGEERHVSHYMSASEDLASIAQSVRKQMPPNPPQKFEKRRDSFGSYALLKVVVATFSRWPGQAKLPLTSSNGGASGTFPAYVDTLVQEKLLTQSEGGRLRRKFHDRKRSA